MRLSEEPFPPYSYVPGKFPHPVSDSAGHGFQIAQTDALETDPRKWQDCRAYLFGFDLFNHGYYWEAHESWEALWHAAGRTGLMADFLKALIKFAAALVKGREGRVEGVRRHARRATELLEVTCERISEPVFMGLVLREVMDQTQQVAASPERFLNTSPQPVAAFDEIQLVLATEGGFDA